MLHFLTLFKIYVRKALEEWKRKCHLKLDKNSEIEFCQEYKYLGVIFDTSGTDVKEIRSRVIQQGNV